MDFNNDRPIYIQLVDNLKVYIISGKIKPGDRLLSVRELALKFKVNPNTVQKALSNLEDMKLIYTDRTNGKYVTLDNKVIDGYRKDLIMEKTNLYLEDMLKLGYSKEEVIRYLKEDN